MAKAPSWPPAALSDPHWQMRVGERAALEGVLSALRPGLAIEIGTAQGGSLRRIAAHSGEVHAIDPDLAAAAELGLANVHLHPGPSGEVLPALLEELRSQDRTIDFVLVDGDHSSAGVEADVAALLGSPATEGAVVVLHDTMSPAVRAGIEAALAAAPQRPLHVELELVAGFLSLQPPFEGELWGGLGLLVIGGGAEAIEDVRRAEIFPLLRAEREGA